MKQLLILSGKGGTGKTTTAAACIRFSQQGGLSPKAIADCDIDAPNLHLVMQQNTQPKLSEFFGGDKAVIDPQKCIGCGACQAHCRFNAIVSWNNHCQINQYACEGCGVCAYVCPQGAVALTVDVAGTKELYTEDGVFSTATLKMGRGNSGKLVTEVKKDMVKNAPPTPFAIIDGSPGIGCPVIASVSGVDLVLIVAEPSHSGMSDLKRLVKTAETFEAKLAVCVNKWDVSPQSTAAIEEFCRQKGIPFVGKVPYDPAATAAINQGLSIADWDCPAQRALKEIYDHTSRLLAADCLE